MTLSYSDKPQLNVSVRSKEKILFQGISFTLTSVNERGKFDVLPFHTNFITLIFDQIAIDEGRTTEQIIKLEKGVLYVMSNNVNVYVGI